MSTSTLDPDHSFERDRQLGLAHSNAALGPSDTSDSGSDVAQGNGLTEELGVRTPRQISELDDEEPLAFDLDQEFNSDGDSDSDAAGTGERAGVAPTRIREGRDIGVDRIDYIDVENIPAEKDDDE